MDDIVLCGGIAILVLYISVILLAAGAAYGILWIVTALLAGRFALAVGITGAIVLILAVYQAIGLALARMDII